MNAFDHETRRKRTPRQRAKIFSRCKGCCHRCGRKLRPGDDWIIEHLVALECGGADGDDNLGISCMGCKLAKDREDHRSGAEIRRKATKHIIPGNQKQTKTKWPKRKFDRWRKMNGDIVIVRDK